MEYLFMLCFEGLYDLLQIIFVLHMIDTIIPKAF